MTEQYDESLWPPVAGLYGAALVLVGLVIIVLLADGQLVLWLSLALIIAWAVLSLRDGVSGPEPPMLARLLPLFAAIILAKLIAPDEWYAVALFVIAGLTFALTRAGRVFYERRSA